jgi:Transposase DDE domain
MAIRRRETDGRVYLEEYRSFRENGKVKTKFVRYIGREGGPPSKKKAPNRVLDRIEHGASVRAGDVTLLWELAQRLGIPRTIDRYCLPECHFPGPTPGKFLTVWAINRVIDPESATKLERWVPTTDIPRLTGLPAEIYTKDNFLEALDTVCFNDRTTGRLVDRTASVDEALFENWRSLHPLPANSGETLAYDLTSVLFFGVTCPLAEFGYNPQDVPDRMQVNLALLVTKHEMHPLCHAVYEGSRHGVTTIRNLLARLSRTQVKRGTMIWDRGVISKKHVNEVTDMGWHLVSGLPKTLAPVQEVLDDTEVPARPETLVRSNKDTAIYAVLTHREVYGDKRNLAVYSNHSRATHDMDQRNDALVNIDKAFSALAVEGSGWPEAKLRKKIHEIAGRWLSYFNIRIKRKGDGPRIAWSYRQHALRAAERHDGKWVLMSTDRRLSANEIVNTYLDKDFIEKVFRTMKTEDELEPVRHRLEQRVRAYMFVQVLAYRLVSAFRWAVVEGELPGNSWQVSEDLLHALGRVERMDVALGADKRTWYLNLTPDTRKKLDKLGFENLLKEDTKPAGSV